MEYLTVRETAEKWNLSTRMVQQLCTAGRIPGAQKFGTAWAIPADAEKPQDPRFVPKQEAASDGLLDHTNLMPLMNLGSVWRRWRPWRKALSGTSPKRSITTSPASRNRQCGRRAPTLPVRTRGCACPPA